MSAKIVYTGVFLSTQKLKKVDQKMGYQPQKVQEKKNSKNGVKTAQRPLFKELWAILVKLEKKWFVIFTEKLLSLDKLVTHYFQVW